MDGRPPPQAALGARMPGALGLTLFALHLFACALFVYVSAIPAPPAPPAASAALAPSAAGGGRQIPLERILSSGILTAILPDNADCRHLYREEAMGLEHELLRAFAGFLGVDLRISSAGSWSEMLGRLEKGEGDLVAAGMPPLPDSQVPVLFTDGHLSTRQQLVVRRGSPKLAGVADLAGRTVHVARGSVYQRTLEQLQAEGVDVRIVALEGVTAEELIRKVADGKVAATVAYDHILRINRRYYPRAMAAGALKDDERLAWAVPPHAHRLRDLIDLFFEELARSGRLSEIHARYYKAADRFEYLDARQFERRVKAFLPGFRPLIEEAAAARGFDWRLVAAQIYQESHFDPLAVSPAGAAGLMQLAPETAEGLELGDPFDPDGNIQAGVAYLQSLYREFEGAVGLDRLKIALAAYNIGLGHVLDARELARQQGLDAERWDSLAQTLPLLADPRYHRQARHGYCRGSEPVRYVERVFFYYDILKRHHLDRASCDSLNLSALGYVPDPEGP